ncbi:TonB-dependent receptor [Caldithrix abyssi]|nr:TonB-dependent receptor [Caldithrix abyssi]
MILIPALFFSFTWGGTTGKITGRTTDKATGEALIGCNLVVEGEELGAATDLTGHYYILNIPPGNYTVKSMMIGYATVRYTNVIVNADFTTTLDFQLSTAVLTGEEITVVAEKPIITKDLTSSKVTIGSETISEMAVEEIGDILELQAGVVRGSDNKIHIRGGRASEVVYLIDGISVSDPFSGEISVEVENNVIQELTVVSGTFNAEYGRAMSGIVEIVTKDGGQKLSGNISTYSGDYLSFDDDVFWNIKDINPGDLTNIQVSLNGPIPGFGNKLTFFGSGRYYSDKGWLYGKRWVTPGFLNQSNPDSVFWAVEPGDSAFVSMNFSWKKTAQGKLTFRPFQKLKLSYGVFWSNSNYRVYDQIFKFNPDGGYKHYKNALTQIFTLNHTISPTTFYTFKLSNIAINYERRVFDDPYDSKYVDIEAYKGRFYNGGTKLWQVSRGTKNYGGRFDLLSQVTNNHEIKTGFEITKYTLTYKDFKVLLDRATDYKPSIGEDVPGNINYNNYNHRPSEFAVYLQDKMEFEDMIINIGVRFDYFDPAGKVPTDPRDPDNAKYFWVKIDDSDSFRIREADFNNSTMTLLKTVDIQDKPWEYKYKNAKPTQKISPRIGIAYPITDRGVIHFSYGHFFQTPPLQYLYYNSEFEVRSGPLNKNEGKGVFDRVYSVDPEAEGNKMGNAELKPQQTVIYELGLQQQIGNDIGIDITGFYKDMRNLLGTEIIEMYDTRLYARYINRDYGNIRGVTFALHKRRSQYVSTSLDYTYQIAEGNASDPNEAFLDAIARRESEIRVVPLDWDQTHTLNVNLMVMNPGSWGLSILGKFGSGLPYTFEPPQTGKQFTRFKNNERKPANITINLNAHKNFNIAGVNGSLFMKVYNLFDRRNEIAVYNDTGRAGYTIRTQHWGEWVDIGSKKQWVNRPQMFSQPRRFILGFSLGF